MSQSDFSLKGDVLKDLSFIESKEWLVTNGLGSYASGNIAGILNRKYHGLLIACSDGIQSERKLLFSKIEEIIEYKNKTYNLAINRWGDSSVQGDLYLEEFNLEGTTPVWTYKLDDCILQKRIWMQEGENTTYIGYYLVQATEAIKIKTACFINCRSHHDLTTELNDYQVEALENGCSIEASMPFYIFSQDASDYKLEKTWYKNYKLSLEEKRGYEFLDNNCKIIEFQRELTLGKLFTIVATTNSQACLNGVEAYSKKIDSQIETLDQSWLNFYQVPSWIKQLYLASKQFIVHSPRKTIIAGYPWFDDWSRDSLISLEGLGEIKITKQILLSYKEFFHNGLLPTRLQEPLQYDNADGALWYFMALKNYLDETKDFDFLRDLFIDLVKAIDWHLEGTKHNIQADSEDGLLSVSSEGLALTWMDAKCRNQVFTPRRGKPLEINALWYNALLCMADWAGILKIEQTKENYLEIAKKVRLGFQKFWNSDLNCLYDVIDTPSGWPDPSIRPNQIFAISLAYSPLTQIQQENILKVCEAHLLTPYGLRSLSFKDAQYIGHYSRGSLYLRDEAYHQGTVWPWLLGPFAIAHYKVFKDKEKALQFFSGFPEVLQKFAIGTLGEVFDGNAPFEPEGCFAQAWSVAEILRAYKFIMEN